MNLEHITTPPPKPTTHQRYASLHRAIEKGMASDAIWSELVEVCLGIGLEDEASSSFRNVENVAQRRYLRSLLNRSGIHVGAEHTVAPPPRAAEPVGPQPSRLGEAVQDTIRFLANDHMPMTVIAATAVFPLVVGFGGSLTRHSPAFVLPVIAIPATLVLVLLVWLARKVVIEAAEGLDDAPALPRLSSLLPDTLRASVDGVVVTGVLVGPSIVALLTGAPWYATTALMLLGLALTPLAVALRTARGSWRALSPLVLLRSMHRGGRRYLSMLGALVVIFLPAAACWALAADSPLFLKIALVGPLVAAPLLVAARLLGRFLHLHPSILALVPVATDAPTEKTATAQNQAASPAAPLSVQQGRAGRQDAKRRVPARGRRTQPVAAPPKRPLAGLPIPAAMPEEPAGAPLFSDPLPTQETPIATAKRAAKRTAKRTPPPARGSLQDLAVVGDEIPDLTQLPGAVVFTGTERRLAGAAAESHPTPR